MKYISVAQILFHNHLPFADYLAVMLWVNSHGIPAVRIIIIVVVLIAVLVIVLVAVLVAVLAILVIFNGIFYLCFV